MNYNMTKPYMREKVELAIKQMAPLKSPELDGFATYFYQHHQKSIEKEVSDTVLDILHRKSIHPTINSTFITLILKKDNLKMVNDFKPIILCNVIYKMISKIICNRLKNIMSLIIYRLQSVFILSRLITDNIIVAYEVLHSMKLIKKKNEGAIAIKIDVSKAYDKIEWPYLQAVLTKMRFSVHWINLIMTCIITVHYTLQGPQTKRLFVSLFIPFVL